MILMGQPSIALYLDHVDSDLGLPFILIMLMGARIANYVDHVDGMA